MRQVTASLLVALAAGFGLFACNLPVAPSVKTPSSTALTADVIAAADCRSGPGQSYALIAALDAGQAVQAVGRNPDGDYLLIQRPGNAAILCWLKLVSAAVVGNPEELPVASIPAPASTVVVGCPTPVGGGPLPVVCSVPPLIACPSPVGGGPTPVTCSVPAVVGCPSPIGGGPTPVVCAATGVPPSTVGCPSPVGGGPTAIECSAGGIPPSIVGCPSPVGGGPTPVDCSGNGAPGLVVGCPSPVGGGPTPVDCSGQGEAPSGGGPPTLLPGARPGAKSTLVPGGRPLPPTPVK